MCKMGKIDELIDKWEQMYLTLTRSAPFEKYGQFTSGRAVGYNECAVELADTLKKVERRVKPSKWHILAEDPTDLPDTGRNVIVQVDRSDELWGDYYSSYGKEWNHFTNVIAWREMPKKYKKVGEP